jgi:hypothetical protein
MARNGLFVNLDAMIKRADFAQKTNKSGHYDQIDTISIRDFTENSLIMPILRKPDFQRETNHWTPAQVVSLLECFINGDLIPSVILWQSETHLFIIDGGHRLSVLRAWILDDYGDGPTSLAFFGDAISKVQKEAAKKTRELITGPDGVGSWQHFKTKIDTNKFDARVSAVISRGIKIQWVTGDVEKAENSFFKINTQGTPLDDIEEKLLRNRKRPIAIASRAVIRAGGGHKYWAIFPNDKQEQVETLAKGLHTILFDPEISSPIKTLDLPLGGSKGIRPALQILIDCFAISCISQTQKTIGIDFGSDDNTGDETIIVLERALKLAKRITGNDTGSLGLHPAIYYYGPSGIYYSAMFLGTLKLINIRLVNNDKIFFDTFTKYRARIEEALIRNKDLIAAVLQKFRSIKRVDAYYDIMLQIYETARKDEEITQGNIISWAGLNGKIVVGDEIEKSGSFSNNIKSKVFIDTALKGAIKCPICNGYIDAAKSVSYDHVIRKQDGGTGDESNCQITHPYCNQSIKN